MVVFNINCCWSQTVNENAPEKVKYLFSENSLLEENNELEVKSGFNQPFSGRSTVRGWRPDNCWQIVSIIFKHIFAWQDAQREHLQKILDMKMKKIDEMKIKQTEQLKQLTKGMPAVHWTMIG